MDHSTIVRNELLLRGLRFVEEYGAFQFTMCSGQRRWRTLLTGASDELVCCSQFPWIRDGCAAALNRFNSEIGTGCFLMMDQHVLFRCGAEILDPLCAGETAVALLRLSGNTVCRYWERVLRCGGADEL